MDIEYHNQITMKYLVKDAGANILVAGSYVFKNSNPTETISKLIKLDF